MGIKVSGIEGIIKQLKEDIQKKREEVAAELSIVGEKVVNGILNGETSSWNDQSGNLRSSVGYIVTIDGQIESEGGFRRFADADEGPSKGKAYARTLAPQYSEGVALIIVAGMEYAAYVEAMENKTVLAQGEIETKRLI